VQVALHRVLIALAEKRIQPQRAGNLLFALQRVSLPLRKPRAV
jgi:hypothetical protein